MTSHRELTGLIVALVLLVGSISSSARAVSREEATPFPELPEKLEPTPDFYKPHNIERPGDEPVLLYTAWGSSATGYLEKIGYSSSEIYRIDLALFQGWGTQSPRSYVANLDERIHEIREDHPNKKVDIIAHSLGGLTARWYIEEKDGAQYVDDLITLAAPNQGSHLFYGLYVFPAAQDMVPGSKFLTRLNKGPLAPEVEYTAVWSDVDEVFLFNLFRSNGARLPRRLIEEHGNARNMLGGSEEHIELAVSWRAFKRYSPYLD